MSSNKTFWFGILGTLFFVSATALGGVKFSDYNHIQQLISESYALGTPNGIYLRIFGFIPSGIFLTLFAYSAFRTLPKSKFSKLGFIGFGLFYSIATIIVSIFPCDEGCNKALINPSVSQLIHNLFGGLTYTITPLCLILIGIKARSWPNGKSISLASILCGISAFVFMVLFFINLNGNYVGLLQRCLEASLLAWVICCSFYIKHFKSI